MLGNIFEWMVSSFAKTTIVIAGKKDRLRKRIESISCFMRRKCKWAVMTVLVLALAACGSLNNEVEEDLLEFEKLETVELHFYFTTLGTQYSYPAEVYNMLDQVSAELAGTINVIPRLHIAKSNLMDFEKDLVLLANAGEQVDAFSVYAFGLFEKDLLLDITGIFKNYAPNYYSELNSNAYGAEKLRRASIGGRIYGIPDNDAAPGRYCVLARKDLVDKYAPGGIDTLEDYSDFLKAVKENEKGILPG